MIGLLRCVCIVTEHTLRLLSKLSESKLADSQLTGFYAR